MTNSHLWLEAIVLDTANQHTIYHLIIHHRSCKISCNLSHSAEICSSCLLSGPVKAGKPGKPKLTKAEKKQKKREENRLKAKLSKKSNSASNAGTGRTQTIRAF